MVDPKKDLRDYLRSNFDATNVSVSFTPSDDVVISDDDGPRNYPQVAVVSKDPVVPGGGQTQATGIDPGSGGAIQDVVYLVQIDCWGGPEDGAPYAGTNDHPDAVANELGEETHRVLFGADPADAPADYEWISAEPPSEADDSEESPTHHREIVIARAKTTYRS